MGNIFDNLQKTAFNTVTNTMGYNAEWVPSTPVDSPAQIAKVLYRGPTEKEKILSVEYNPEKLEMEYQEGFFDGLKSMADENIFETVTIEGVGEFKVKSVLKKYDGKTYVARIEPKIS